MPAKKPTNTARIDLLEARFNIIEQDFVTLQNNLNKTISQVCAIHRTLLGIEYWVKTGKNINL